ncbi:hypothetical protein GUJ93_ZPchr0007g6028 [Zizania palustris]|uniref:Wall-associated receptor kinase galacturonan-binding domain-containing protein n=1 Tax=Zizania palustris TaxID=103762 RepID=A0A8J5W445_ZIZPA|nr:hypothetical protein GUJ93_ZPchr0007g6028 [Zizania palustris]
MEVNKLKTISAACPQLLLPARFNFLVCPSFRISLIPRAQWLITKPNCCDCEIKAGKIAGCGLVSPVAMAHTLSLLHLILLVGVHASVSHGSSSLQPEYDTSICSKSYSCGDVNISYPFYLSDAIGETYDDDDNTSFSCGYTDLKLTCLRYGANNTTATIQLAGHEYTVQGIVYGNDTVVLADSDALRGGKCPRVSHNVSFDEEWLHYTSSVENLTFLFGCNLAAPTDPRINSAENKNKISCKDSGSSPGGGSSFVFTPEELGGAGASSEYDELAKHCHPPVVVPVDVNLLREMGSNRTVLLTEYGAVIENGFELDWHLCKNDDGCNPCEKSQGQCAYRQDKTFLGCLCSDGKMAMDSPYCSGSSKSFQTCILQFYSCESNKYATNTLIVYQS